LFVAAYPPPETKKIILHSPSHDKLFYPVFSCEAFGRFLRYYPLLNRRLYGDCKVIDPERFTVIHFF